MCQKKIVVVGGTGYLCQHLLQFFADINVNGTNAYAYDLTYSTTPPQPLFDVIPSSLTFQVDLKTGHGFEVISNAFGQVLFDFGYVDNA